MLVIAIVIASATHNTILMDFSVDLLHTMERDMDTEIVKLMKAVSVSSPSDISQSALNKLNKGPLITFFLSMLKMYEKNVSMCKSAAVKLDHMKNEKIDLQKQLIDFQSEQMNSAL